MPNRSVRIAAVTFALTVLGTSALAEWKFFGIGGRAFEEGCKAALNVTVCEIVFPAFAEPIMINRISCQFPLKSTVALRYLFKRADVEVGQEPNWTEVQHLTPQTIGLYNEPPAEGSMHLIHVNDAVTIFVRAGDQAKIVFKTQFAVDITGVVKCKAFANRV